MESIVDLCKQNDISCVFLTQPSDYQKETQESFKEGFWATPPNADYTVTFASLIHLASTYNNFLLDLAQKNSFPVCDLASSIPASYEYFYDDCHFNEKGSKKVASEIFSCLQEQKHLLPTSLVQ